MDLQRQTILLESSEHFHGRLPPHHLGMLFVDLPVAVRGAVSMALRNRSQSKGRKPDWLLKASDIRFVRHGGNGATELAFELPTLESAAWELYDQQVLFKEARPPGLLTGLDLLANAIDDAAARKADSTAFDHLLLKRITRIGRVFQKGPFTGLRIFGSDAAQNSETTFNPEIAKRTKELCCRTPRPQRVRLLGQLDGIQASTQRFSLLLDGGELIVGVFPDDHAEQVQTLWNSRVLVKGTAVYRPSGDLLRVDADKIEAGNNVSVIFSRLPKPGHSRIDAGKLRCPQGPRSGMAAIMGKWPGDETDEQINEALERIS